MAGAFVGLDHGPPHSRPNPLTSPSAPLSSVLHGRLTKASNKSCCYSWRVTSRPHGRVYPCMTVKDRHCSDILTSLRKRLSQTPQRSCCDHRGDIRDND